MCVCGGGGGGVEGACAFSVPYVGHILRAVLTSFYEICFGTEIRTIMNSL